MSQSDWGEKVARHTLYPGYYANHTCRRFALSMVILQRHSL
jgi:hypothetical protein